MPVGKSVIDTNHKRLKSNTNVSLDKNGNDDNDYNYSDHNSIEGGKKHKIGQLQVITQIRNTSFFLLFIEKKKTEKKGVVRR